MLFKTNTLKIEPYERIEFGFVLLPDKDILQKIKVLSETIYIELQNLPIRENLPTYWGANKCKTVEIPHISIGQYGVLGVEIEDIKSFVEDVSRKTSTMIESMNQRLSVLDEHIFFDVENCFEKVNPNIRDLYCVLRDHYFNKIQTKFPIAQSLFYKKKHPNCIDEINLINLYFQNWGIPEGNRIRPHFTLFYHPHYKKNEMEECLHKNVILQDKIRELKSIQLSHIGIVQIDAFGNPLKDGLICSFSLNRD